MLIAKVTNDKIKVADFRSLFPNTSFPRSGPGAQWLQNNGCYPVTMWKPTTETQKLVPCEPYIEDGQVFTVQVQDKTAEDIEAETQSLSAKVRAQRDRILAQSDWRVMKSAETGTPMDADWEAYRQALRDVPQQEGFPQTVEWPNDPDYVEQE